jgi:hypothetical protein
MVYSAAEKYTLTALLELSRELNRNGWQESEFAVGQVNQIIKRTFLLGL